MGMDAADQELHQTLVWLLKHELRLYPRSRIAGFNDEAAEADAAKLVEGLKRRRFEFRQLPAAPLHSADCGRRNR